MPFGFRRKNKKALPQPLQSYVEALNSLKLGDKEKFRLSGKYLAQVVKVYDGDTITVCINPISTEPWFTGVSPEDWLENTNQFSVRMYGYDSPELKPPKSMENREEHVKAAKEARDFLANMILNRTIVLDVIPDDDKYGRLLGKVYARDSPLESDPVVSMEEYSIYVNDIMKEEGHGYEYYGGTKK